MRYSVRVGGRLTGIPLHDYIEIVERAPGDAPDETVLTVRVADAAALTGVVALLHDLGLTVTEMHALPDVSTS
ncbi:hypothetical protein [Luteimicrobium sp. DT211]|uniref:hypothetical protein n=1 Tax=Luteimicrobium sp. DT211 TaxID=3393412 RepID=UPI003CF56A69